MILEGNYRFQLKGKEDPKVYLEENRVQATTQNGLVAPTLLLSPKQFRDKASWCCPRAHNLVHLKPRPLSGEPRAHCVSQREYHTKADLHYNNK
jgi:hypothetical protein